MVTCWPLTSSPSSSRDERHTGPVWKRLEPIFQRWRRLLPDGGPIPEEAPTLLLPGFSLDPPSLKETALLENAVFPAFQEYLELYLELVAAAEPVQSERAGQLLAGQRRYTDYRAEKDPARGMLSRFYGAEWTEAYIHDFLFDLPRSLEVLS